ncbi:HipA family kinase [Rhodopirellula europaea]|uniref:HipA family kinase n=1 Tax=Rhodopirellula europaea TaxID=1263866 RepID=UPI001F2FCD15|nr:HipA family kinase [Rhodopirellula europaea]
MTNWTPTTIKRRIPTDISSSTRPTHVVTDQGNAYIKWPSQLRNSQGATALASELIGTGLAEWFGLPTFEYAVMQACEADAFPDSDDENLVPVFLTKEVEGDTWKGTAKELNQVENKADISRLVVFDTFACNSDRHLIFDNRGQQREHRNDGNVFLSQDAAPKMLRLRVYDHTHCHYAVIDASGIPAYQSKIEDPAIYGLFPEFRNFLDRDVVKEAAAKLLKLDLPTITNIVDAVPDEWIRHPESKDRWKSFIRDRARFVSNHIESKIFPQGEFSYE